MQIYKIASPNLLGDMYGHALDGSAWKITAWVPPPFRLINLSLGGFPWVSEAISLKPPRI